MRRFIALFFVALALVTSSCKGPSPTVSPSPTVTDDLSANPSATPTPSGSPVPRITIVPSATRLSQSTAPATPLPTADAGDAGPPSLSPSPTALDATAPSRTPAPSAVATATPSPTAPPSPRPPESPLPTPTPFESPLGVPAPTDSEGALPTPTPTPPEDGDEPQADWRFENLYTYYDDESPAFYVGGEAVNLSGDHRQITSLWPVVYGANGEPVNDKQAVDATSRGYKELREGINLPPGLGLAFSFRVDLPSEALIEEEHDLLIESEPVAPGREELEILRHQSDDADWPAYFYVAGVYEVPDADLAEYVAVVVTVYDEDGRVLGLGWLYEDDGPYLASGEHEFEVEVEMWDLVSALGLKVGTYAVQIFGY